MINEYAIEPKVLVEPNGLWQRLEDIGISHGRFIADCPNGGWLRMAERALCATYSDLDSRTSMKIRKWIERTAKESGVFRRCHGPQVRQAGSTEAADWMEFVMEENTKDPFHAIVCSRKPSEETRENVIDKADIDHGHELWRRNQTAQVPREASAIAALVLPLTRISHDLIFVDPYFGVSTERFGAISQIISDAQNDAYAVHRVEVHCVPRPNKGESRQDCIQRMKDNISNHFHGQAKACGIRNRKIVVKIWNDRSANQQFHDRYVLTNRGGILFTVGLDEGQNADQVTQAVLLDEEAWQVQMRQFNEHQTDYRCPFRLASPPVVVRV